MKEVNWGETHGEGDIYCYCDCGGCHSWEDYPIEDGIPDFRSAQIHIRELGWTSLKIGGFWRDFCSETCRNTFIRENT